MYDDVRLWDALRRSFLVESSIHKGETLDSSSGSSTPTSRFTLDTVIESEGANLSVGERSLLSLARALVKDSKVVGVYRYSLAQIVFINQKSHSSLRRSHVSLHYMRPIPESR